jgi:hypothetical protein
MKQNAGFCFRNDITQKLQHPKIMKVQKIIGEHGILPQLCNQGACPAAILTDDDNIFVQGFLPNRNEDGQLIPPSGEGFVRMPRQTFERIARQVLGS